MAKTEQDGLIDAPISDPKWIREKVRKKEIAELVADGDGGLGWKRPLKRKENEPQEYEDAPTTDIVFLGYPFTSMEKGLLMMAPGFPLVHIGTSTDTHCMIFARADVYKTGSREVRAEQELFPPQEEAEKDPEAPAVL